MKLGIIDIGSLTRGWSGKFGIHAFSRREALRGLGLLAAAATLATISPTFAADGVPLAIKGYDPVAYFTDGKPMPGRPEFEYEWDEHLWRFSSEEHRELFKANPVRYAPQFGNYCAMALSLGQIVEANPENWLITDGKLYVFGKPAPGGAALFQQHLAENIAKANQNQPILPKQ
jgi:YHS domain-containing protein